MSARPPAPTRTGLVGVVDQRIKAAWTKRRTYRLEVSAEEWRAVAAWAVAWHKWYRQGNRKAVMRIRDGQLEVWWPDTGWTRIQLGMDGCMLVRPAQQSMFA